MFGCVVKLQSIPNPFRFLRSEGAVECCWRVRVQIILYRYHLRRLRKMHIDQFSHTLGRIGVRASIRDYDAPLIAQRCEEHEQITHTVTLECTLKLLRFTQLDRQRPDHLAMLFFVAFIKADQRMLRVE